MLAAHRKRLRQLGHFHPIRRSDQWLCGAGGLLSGHCGVRRNFPAGALRQKGTGGWRSNYLDHTLLHGAYIPSKW